MRLPFFSIFDSTTKQTFDFNLKYFTSPVSIKNNVITAFNNYLINNNKAKQVYQNFSNLIYLGYGLAIATGFDSGLLYGGLALTGSCIIEYYHQKQAKHFAALNRKQKFIEEFQSSGVSLPKLIHPETKEPLSHSFNHFVSVVKHKGYLFYAIRNSRHKLPDWKLLYIDGLESKQIPKAEIKLDGRNCMIRVASNNKEDLVYHKKTHREKIINDNFIIYDLMEDPRSVRPWFTLPVFRFLRLDQFGLPLKLEKLSHWTASHSGRFKHWVKDSRGKRFFNWVSSIVTEFKGNKIILHDPYVELNSEYQINLPNQTKILLGDCSASEHGFIAIVEEMPCILIRRIDYDDLNLNPILPSTYDQNDFSSRLFPSSYWYQEDLPVSIGEVFDINMVQYGSDDQNIEVRIIVKNGFYYKTYNKDNWDFYELSAEYLAQLPHLNRMRHNRWQNIENLAKPVCYEFDNLNLVINNINIIKITIHDFDKFKDHTPISFLDENNIRYDCLLFRSKNMIKAFLGLKSESWLIIGAPYAQNSYQLFGVNKCYPVSIIQFDDHKLVIQGEIFMGNICGKKRSIVVSTYEEKAIEEESKQALDRTSKVADATLDVGENILDKLDEQGRQLDRIEATTIDTSQKVDTAVGSYHGTKSCLFGFARSVKPNCFDSKPDSDKSDDSQLEVQEQTHPRSSASNPHNPDDMQGKLNHLGRQIADINQVADKIGEKLDHQNDQIDDITKDTKQINKKIKNRNRVCGCFSLG